MDAITTNVRRIRAARRCPEHCSFWLTPETMEYIRTANKLTRIPQGVILQLLVDYMRLTRVKGCRELDDDERDRLAYVKRIFTIFPL